jgi:hypothetical protein
MELRGQINEVIQTRRLWLNTDKAVRWMPAARLPRGDNGRDWHCYTRFAWPLARRLLRDIGGQNLAAAEGFLGALSQFGDEGREAAE